MVCKTIWTAVLAANLAIATSAAQAARTWTDTTGKFKVTADLVAVEGDSVQLDLGDRKIVVPLAKLSEADRQYVKNHLEAQRPAPSDTSDKNTGQANPADLVSAIDTKIEVARARGVQFGPDGKPKPPPLKISLLLTGPPAQSARSYGKLNIKSITDENGKSLTADTKIFGDDVAEEMLRIDRESSFDKHPQDGIRVKFKLAGTDNPPAKLATLAGTVQVETGGTAHTIELNDVISSRGPVKSKALADLGIRATLKDTTTKVNGRRQQGVAVQLSGAFDKLDSVELVAGDGSEIPELGSARGGGGGMYSYDFGAPKVPADAKLVFTYITGAVQVEVPFEFENVALPAPPKRRQ